MPEPSLPSEPPRLTDHQLAHWLLPAGGIAAGPQDAAPILHCLHLESADGYLTVVTTDRCALYTATIYAGLPDFRLNAHLALPAVKDLGKALRACLRKNKAGPAFLSLTGGGSLRVDLPGESNSHLLVDTNWEATYPTWRILMDMRFEPRKDRRGPRPLFDLDANRLGKFAGIHPDGRIRMEQRGAVDRPIVITPFPDGKEYEGIDFLGLLMPCRPPGDDWSTA